MSEEAKSCSRCGGSGSVPCPGCNGSGSKNILIKENGEQANKVVSCAGCNGRGVRTCGVCGSSGKS